MSSRKMERVGEMFGLCLNFEYETECTSDMFDAFFFKNAKCRLKRRTEVFFFLRSKPKLGGLNSLKLFLTSILTLWRYVLLQGLEEVE